jgi:DNA-binding NarL/FixJ family response regulator
VLHNEMLENPSHGSRGGEYLPAVLAAALEAQSDALSKREVKVLELVARGLGNKQIAYALHITETIKHIWQKLEAQDRTQAATAAIQCSIIHLRGPSRLRL